MKNLYELVKLDPTLKDNRDDKRMRKRNEVYNLAKMKLDSWIKMTLISEDAEIEMKQAILDLVRGYGFPNYSPAPPTPPPLQPARSASPPAAIGACLATLRPSSGSPRRKRFPYNAAPEKTLPLSRRLSPFLRVRLLSRTYQAESKFRA